MGLRFVRSHGLLATKQGEWKVRGASCWSVMCSHTFSSPPLLAAGQWLQVPWWCCAKTVPSGKGAWQLRNGDPSKHCCPMQHSRLLLMCCPCLQPLPVAGPGEAGMGSAEVHPSCTACTSSAKVLIAMKGRISPLLAFSHSGKPAGWTTPSLG